MPAKQNDHLYSPSPLPALEVPSGASAKVQIIDTTTRISAPASLFMQPVIEGLDVMQESPAFSFLVEQASSGRRVLFDLGMRKDWRNLAPAVLALVDGPGWRLKSEQNVADILQDNGIDVAGGAIEAAIWSHWHFDHTGDVSAFPKTTVLITGTGVAQAFIPGYPTNLESPVLESDFAGREHREIDFGSESVAQIGKFKGVDYFQDGSFYLLNAPGHAIGHICALARVTSTQEGDPEDTFIFMGADAAHHGGVFRPSEYLPLPKDIRPSPYQPKYATSCPGHVFEAVHPQKRGDMSFYQISEAVAHDKEIATQSVGNMQEFDANDNFFVVIAHDATLLDETVGIEWFPHGTLKDWKAKGLSTKVQWAFLKDFVHAVELQNS